MDRRFFLASPVFVRIAFHMTDSAEAHAPILAAGGIVLRDGSRPRIAIVRLRRGKDWVLPKGKLYPGERPHVAAKREVLEETGHDVSVHEFLGSMSYPVDRKIKIVQFWHMRAIGGPVRELDRDVKAVKWLPLKEAIETLSRPHEKVFLANVGPVVVKAARQALRNKIARPAVRSKSRRVVRRPQPAPVAPAVPIVQLAGDDARAAGNPLVKTIGGWIGRLMPHPSARRLG
jgi:8-oxo-dGTP diphosphatase